MLVFLDFEASSLGKRSYPIEVGWVFADGRSRAYLIRPAEGWTDWDARSEAIHRISQARLLAEGTAHDLVAQDMIESLSGHDLVASAVSWDGKWMSALLRAAGLPRHSLRLRDSDALCRESALAILAPVIAPERLNEAVAQCLAKGEVRAPGQPPAHRALADAQEERARWLAVTAAARAVAAVA
jgi:hypothetical protein